MRNLFIIFFLLFIISISNAQNIPDVVTPDLQGKEYDHYALLDQGKHIGIYLYWTT